MKDRVFIINGAIALPYLKEHINIELIEYGFDRLDTIFLVEEILTVAITETLRDQLGYNVRHNFNQNTQMKTIRNVINYTKDIVWNELSNYVMMSEDGVYIIRVTTVMNNIHIVITG